MAIAKMSRLRLIGLKSDKNKIMHVLQKSGSFEVMPTNVQGEKGADRSHLDKVLHRQAKVAFAIEYLSACAAEYADKKHKNDKDVQKGTAEPMRAVPVTEQKGIGRRIVGYDDFYDAAAKEYELVAVCDELEKLNFARLENKSALQKLRGRLRAVLPYKAFPLPFSALGDRGAVTVLLAQSDKGGAVSFGDTPVFTERYASTAGVLVSVVVLRRDQEKALSALSAAGYVLCTLSGDDTPAERIESLRAEEETLAACDTEAMYEVLSYHKYLSDLKTLYDVLGQDVERSEAELEFVTTQNTFVAEGWVPSEAASDVLAKIGDKTPRIVSYVSDPTENDTPPTLIVSKKIVKPYEDVTNMYSVPGYHEIDPNPFMAVFFFVFFGIMIGDAGYGLILSIASLLICRFCKLEKGTARLLALVGMGGVSAIIWGVLFGGVFSISGIPPLWFNPTDEPLMMLGVSIVLGAVQLLTGYALHSAALFRNGKPLDAVLDSVFIFVLFGGAACLALHLLTDLRAPLLPVGLGLMIVALAGILCTAGRHNKGVLHKIMGGFSGLYGLVNLLSDLLSYARLFGLGLASGAIGMAFNTLGGMFFSVPVVGYVIGIIVLIPLHAFNLGIGVLGAYVHNARLQFLEFYGKFYEGGGRLFSPMGEKTKYVRFAR